MFFSSFLLLVAVWATSEARGLRGGVMRPAEYELAEFLANRRAHPFPKQIIDGDLPTSFDVRDAFPGCTGPILNQGQCGSCWAFASSEVLSNRFCIQTKGAVNVTLSPEDALGCEDLHLGCTMGSMPEWAWPYLVRKGIATIECVPYTSGNGTAMHHCPTECTSTGSPVKKYYAANYTHAGDFIDARKHTAAIMRALMSGPLDATFIVYGDFDSYQVNEVYQHKSGGFEGLHSVKIVGWGQTPEGVLYWTVANSWGTDWPNYGLPPREAGYFKILRGVDECMFESQVYYGAADTTRL